VSVPFLSIILPAHNEEQRLTPSLEKVEAFLRAQPYTSEVIVVENGSSDRTYEAACAFRERIPNLRVLQESGRGKGLAVRRGMIEAVGAYRIFCDVDFSMPVEEITRFIPPALPTMDVAIASREAKGGVRYNEPELRHFIGRGFNTLVRWMALPGLQDTQCGFKCFRADVAEAVFARQTLGGMSFDVEVLYIARCRGYHIQEVAIDWYFDSDSRVRLMEDSMRMFFDLLTIRRNARLGMYG
jgi:glycosyltransferase involved in cell wall biosynthesis